MRFRAPTLGYVLCAVMLGGCPGPEDAGDEGLLETDGAGQDTEAGQCVPGQSIPCSCGDGTMGAQQCNDDGSGYGACGCSGEGSASDGTGTSAGSGDPSGTTGVDSGEATTGGSTSGGGSTEGTDTGMAAPTFDDVKIILGQSCGAYNDACHSRVAFGANLDFDCRGWASFEDAPLGAEFYAGPGAGNPTGCPDMGLYTRLIDLNSWQCGEGNPGPGLPLVVPGDPDSSYIIQKIDGDVCNIAGEPSDMMPPPESGFVLPPQSYDTLRAWIDAGAPQN